MNYGGYLISEALKINTTLTELDLTGELINEWNKTKKRK